jgi:hypothetical protein
VYTLRAPREKTKRQPKDEANLFKKVNQRLKGLHVVKVASANGDVEYHGECEGLFAARRWQINCDMLLKD